MEIESSIVASQNSLAINPLVREPQREADTRQQQEQRQNTELPQTQVVNNRGSAQAFEQAERFRQQQQTFYDQPNNRARQALNAYQSLTTEQRRSELQQLVGVDTYA